MMVDGRRHLLEEIQTANLLDFSNKYPLTLLKCSFVPKLS